MYTLYLLGVRKCDKKLNTNYHWSHITILQFYKEKVKHLKQCSANNSLFANNWQIDQSQIYLLIFKSPINSNSYLPHFKVIIYIPICKYFSLMNIFVICKYFQRNNCFKHKLWTYQSQFWKIFIPLMEGALRTKKKHFKYLWIICKCFPSNEYHSYFH